MDGFLSAVPLIAALPDTVRTALSERAEVVRVGARDWVFRQNDDGDALYVIRLGLVQVVKESPQGEEVIRVLGRGEFFGELALLDGAPRSASIRTLRDTELLRIRQEDFHAILLENPKATLRIAHHVGMRLRTRDGGGKRSRRGYLGVIALLPTRDLMDFDAVQRHFLAYLNQVSNTALLEIDATGHLDGQLIDPARYGEVLDDHERKHDLVVLVVRPENTVPEWRAFVLRQADRLVQLAEIESTPKRLAGTDRPFSLALIDYNDTPHPALSWIETCAPARHFRLRVGERLGSDVGRMARRLTERSIGVVCSGGGARAMAHIGAVTTLRGAGLQLDRFAGVSMGSLVAALFANEHSSEDIKAICMEHLASSNPFNDYTFPVVSLVRARKARLMLGRIFGPTRIEDLPRDYFCLTADLLNARSVVHRTGELVIGIGASMSIPGVAPPVTHEGTLLVDGGVLNNFPVDVMMETGEGPVVGCDLTTSSDDDGAVSLPPAPVPLLRFLVGTSARELPDIFQTLTRTSTLGSYQAAMASRAMADLAVTSWVGHLGFFDFKKLDEAFDAGRKAADEALEQAEKNGTLAELMSLSPRVSTAERIA